MSTITTPHVGRVYVPQLAAVTFGPATPSGTRTPRYTGIVSYRARHWDAQRERFTDEERAFGVALQQTQGLLQKWRDSEELQRLFPSADAFVAAVRQGRTQAAITHNERIQNGARMLFKSFWGLSTSPTNATVATPSYVALDSSSTFTAANYTWAHDGTDQSLGNGSAATGANVTTNEFTTAGLARAAGTVGSYADPTALDGVATCTVTHTFTCTSGPQTVYGTGLVDAASTAAFNLFAEAPFTSATLQTNDTLAITWNISA
jgi:hypothetical protein